MHRTVHVRRQITGEPKVVRDVLIDRLPELLQTSSGDEVSTPDGDGSFLMTLHDRGLGIQLTKHVRVHLGEATEHGHWTRVPIRWEADPAAPLFPSFDGAIEFEQLDSVRCEIAVFGRYRPPLGILGAAGDLVFDRAPHRVAASVVDRLVGALAEALHGAGVAPQPSGDLTEAHVRAIMTADVLTFAESDSLRSAARTMLGAGVSGAPVVDQYGAVIGVLSERDLLDKMTPSPSWGAGSAPDVARRHAALTVGQACSRPAATTEADARVSAAADVMGSRGVGRLVVMDGARVVGIVTRSDVLRMFLRTDEELQAACEHALAENRYPDVEVTVADGMVGLGGRVTARSSIGHLGRMLRAIDGVLDVSADEVSWEVDDLIPSPWV